MSSRASSTRKDRRRSSVVAVAVVERRSTRARTPPARRSPARSAGSQATNWSPRGRSTCTRPGMTSPNVDTTSWNSSEHAVASSAMIGPSSARPSRSTSAPSATTRCAAVPSTSKRQRRQVEQLDAARRERPGVAQSFGEVAEELLGVHDHGRAREPGSPVDRRRHAVILLRTRPRSSAVGTAAAAGDGSFVDAEVAGDHLRVVAHGHGIAFGDHATDLEAVHAIADAHDERHVVLDHQHRRTELPADLLDQRTECLGLALRDAGGRLVEAQHACVEGEEPGQLDDAAGPGGEVGDAVAGVATETEEADEVVGLGAPLRVRE